MQGAVGQGGHQVQQHAIQRLPQPLRRRNFTGGGQAELHGQIWGQPQQRQQPEGRRFQHPRREQGQGPFHHVPQRPVRHQGLQLAAHCVQHGHLGVAPAILLQQTGLANASLAQDKHPAALPLLGLGQHPFQKSQLLLPAHQRNARGRPQRGRSPGPGRRHRHRARASPLPGLQLRGQSLGLWRGGHLQLPLQQLGEQPILLQSTAAVPHLQIQPHQQPVGRFVQRVGGHPALGPGQRLGRGTLGRIAAGQPLQGAQVALPQFGPRLLYPILVHILQQISPIQGHRLLQQFQRGLRPRLPPELLHIHPQWEVRLQHHIGAGGLHQVRRHIFQRPPQAVQILAQIAPGRGLGPPGPKSICQPPTIQRLAAMIHQIGKQRTRGGRSQVQGLALSIGEQQIAQQVHPQALGHHPMG